jgi:pimeloyl-ACP methyl ester carboxylesterase
MAPVGRELASRRGVLEPIQTAATLDGQIEELRLVLDREAAGPRALVGYSWGAWLSFLVAARHPALVQALVLVGAPPFEERFVAELDARRRGRLAAAERGEFDRLVRLRREQAAVCSDADLARLGALAAKADAVDPLPWESEAQDRVAPRGVVFSSVWPAAAALRRSGALLSAGRDVACPVVAIHGDSDPHPAAGVKGPLSSVLADFRFIELRECGHTPWLERRARVQFYSVLEGALDRLRDACAGPRSPA